ncbi:MAG: nucleotidyltransferase family protein [Candidatus Entotheonellia bacterium]
MHPLIQDRVAAVADLCVKYHVRRLARFGSATSQHFDPIRNDLDVLVEFQLMPPVQHADSYFGLMEDLVLLRQFTTGKTCAAYKMVLLRFGPSR